MVPDKCLKVCFYRVQYHISSASSIAVRALAYCAEDHSSGPTYNNNIIIIIHLFKVGHINL